MCYGSATRQMALHWSTPQREGFALAAVAQNDAGGAAASPGLSAEVVSEACATARAFERLERRERHERLRALLSPGQLPDLDESRLPARALGLLAANADRMRGRRWLANSAPPRAGFRAERGLRTLLRALVATQASTDEATP